MKRFARLLLAAAIAGCGPATPPAGDMTVPITTQQSQLAANLAALGNARIFFSHHSVGENILQGIRHLASESNGAPPLRILALEQAATTPGPALFHASGGRNGDPASKIAFFEAALRGNAALKPEVALMKFCYVDVVPTTDVDALLAQYRKAIAGLKRDHPGVVFAHVTMPLVPRPTDIKSQVRRVLGLQEWTDASNVKRHEFNRKLAQAFPADPLFDLARIESTAPDGTPVFFEVNGERVPSMARVYTEDNGHLNAAGQRAAGAAAIRMLADTLVRRAGMASAGVR
jgi:hypothetical protein